MEHCRIQYPEGLSEKHRLNYEAFLERCIFIERSARRIAKMIAKEDAVDRLKLLDRYHAIDEHNRDPNNNWDSTKDIEEQIKANCSCFICWGDIWKVEEMFGIKTSVNDFYNGGLRWNVFTAFC